jgi:hypothetical protein
LDVENVSHEDEQTARMYLFIYIYSESPVERQIPRGKKPLSPSTPMIRLGCVHADLGMGMGGWILSWSPVDRELVELWWLPTVERRKKVWLE